MAASRLVRALFAFFAYSSVHWAARNWRRALFWDVLLFGIMAASFWIPVWLVFVVMLAQIVDAATFTPVREPFTGELWAALAIVGLVGTPMALALRAFWIEAFSIPSGALIPTLQVGDHIFVAKQARTPRRGDVIVFKHPKEPDKDFVKRVVAVGGDTIEIRDDQLVVDDAPVPRRHVDEPCSYDDFLAETGEWQQHACEAWDETVDGRTYRVIFDKNGTPHSFAPVAVPPGHYFVMGDNRDNSHDSRYWGFVPADHVKGTARKIWWSRGAERRALGALREARAVGGAATSWL